MPDHMPQTAPHPCPGGTGDIENIEKEPRSLRTRAENLSRLLGDKQGVSLIGEAEAARGPRAHRLGLVSRYVLATALVYLGVGFGLTALVEHLH